MHPVIIAGLVILSFLSVKEFTSNPIDREVKAYGKNMERRLTRFPVKQSQEAANHAPVAVITVPETDVAQSDLPSDVDLGTGGVAPSENLIGIPPGEAPRPIDSPIDG